MTEKQITMHAEAIVDDHGRIKVGDVEGHPIWFDPRDGTLEGEVRGQRVTHRTYSTLRKLMFQRHLETQDNTPTLLVRVPSSVRRYSWAMPSTTIAAVTALSGRLRDGVVDTAGRFFDADDFAALPIAGNEAEVKEVVEAIDGFQDEVKAEEARHNETIKAISDRALTYAESVKLRHPLKAVIAGMKDETAIKRDEDRRAFASR